MEAKHTPGPWKTGETATSGPGRAIFAGEDIQCLATVSGELMFPGQSKANAALIAAAPELLSALHDTLDHCMLSWTSDDPRAVKARAAIAKATGGGDA